MCIGTKNARMSVRNKKSSGYPAKRGGCPELFYIFGKEGNSLVRPAQIEGYIFDCEKLTELPFSGTPPSPRLTKVTLLTYVHSELCEAL